MTQPTAYTRQADFSSFEASNPTDPKSGASLDAEFDAVKVTTDQVRSNLAILQRDDTLLGNNTVHVEALSSAVKALLSAEAGTIRGAWLTATAYVVKDVVVESGLTYICAVAHTSGTFATDLAAVKWVKISSAATAATITYDNSTSLLAASTVQDAIDEVDGDLDTHIADTTTHGISSFGATVVDDTTALAMQTTMGLVLSTLVSGTDHARFVRLGGDFFICLNCDYDTVNSYWYRIDETKYAFRIGMYINAIPGEADQGIVFERALPSSVGGSTLVGDTGIPELSPTKKIGTSYGSLGSFELMFDLTAFRDIVIGGLGMEIDGAGTVPFFRIVHGAVLSAKTYHGIMTNVFNDFSGTDRTNKPSIFLGMRTDVATGLAQEFVIMWAPANTPGGASTSDTTTPTFSDIIAVSVNSGTTPLTNQGWLRRGAALTTTDLATAATTTAHGLGAKPDILIGELVCLTTDAGYSATNTIRVSLDRASNASATAWSVYDDATNVVALINGGTINAAHKTTRANTNLTNANWQLKITPYAFV